MDAMSTIVDFFTEGGGETIKIGSPDAYSKFKKRLNQLYKLGELQEILDCEDNMLIIAGAGSGKTTSLLLKILRDIVSGRLVTVVYQNGQPIYKLKKILIATFLRTGAEDLRKKFDELCKNFKIVGISSKDLTIRTLDSEILECYKKLYELMGKKVEVNIVSEKDTKTFVREACDYYKIRSLTGRGKRLSDDELSDIECMLSYYRNRLDNGKFNHPLMSEYNLNEVTINGIIERVKQLKKLNDVKDFVDLEEEIYKAYSINPKVAEFVASRYDFVYLDEFQDTSQLQYGYLLPYLRSAESFVICGDDDQAIYSWRGSDIALIKERVSKDFNPTIKFLTVNRRCPENILNPVIPSITENSFRHPKNLKSANEGGQVDIIIDGGIQYLLDSLKTDLGKSEKIGILGRTNADLLVPTLVLLLNKFNSFSVSQQVSFKSGFARKILGSMQLILHRYNEDFDDYFRQFVGKDEHYQITKLCDTLASCKTESIYTLPLEDLQYSTPGLFYLIKMLRENKDDPVGAYVKMLSYMETDAYRGKTIYAQRARDFIYYLRRLILEHPRLKGKSIEELYDIFNNELPLQLEKKMLKREYKVVNGKKIYFTPDDDSYIRITTIHDAKGKEWDNVYIWNDVDGCFPNSVGSRELSEEEFEEERRVHYIAWTRARKKLTVFTRSDVAAGFLGECDLESCNIYQLKETKAGVRDIESVLNKQIFKNKSNTATVENDKPTKSWKDCFREYVAKYSSYEKIGSKEGNNLDICFTKLGGMDKVADYLLSCKIDCYPVEEIEGAISDLLESKVLSME